jgi:hypothetical protein
VTFVALPGVDGLRSFRMLLEVALRRFGLRAIDVRQCAPDAREDKRAFAQPRRQTMSAFSDRVRSQKKGMFKVADLDGGKELTLTISHLDEQVELFGKEVDLLNFVETGRQLQLNQTTSEFLLDTFGDNPGTYAGNKVVLHLGEYEFNREKKLGIRLKMPGQASPATNGPPPQARALPPRRQDLDDEIPF